MKAWSRDFGFGAMAAVCCLTAAPVFGATWYVDKGNASGTETGEGWRAAFSTIQPAIDAAHADGGGEVWVAKGTYNEPRHFVQEEQNTGAIALKPGVALYGGFAGKEKRREQRDWEKNPTIISGEKSRDGERAYHVVVGADKSRLDGFHVTGAHSWKGKPGKLRAGGAITCWNLTMTIANCRVLDNVSEGNGGGIYCYNSNVTIEGCVIEDNASSLQGEGGGGGICFVRCADSLVLGCLISRNRAGFLGGGIYCYNASPTIRDTRFEGNTSRRGGGLGVSSVSSPLLENCIIAGNQASCGGAMRIRHHSNPKLRTCVIKGNSGTASAGGVSLFNASSIELSGCEVADNASPQGGAVNLCRATMAAVNTTFKNNQAAQGAGVWFHQEADAIISGCTFEANTPHAIGIRQDSSSLSVAATRFRDHPDGILREHYSDRTYATLKELEATFASWKGNAQGDAPLVVAETGGPDGSGLGPLDFPEEPEATSIEIATTETKFLFKGRLAVVAVFVVVLMVVLVAAGVYLISSDKRSENAQTRRSHSETESRFEPVDSKPAEE